MKKSLCLLSLMILAQSWAWSQYAQIKGQILDKTTNELIPYCAVSIQNATIGTCSNSRGEFIFNYPDSLKNGDLNVKCIGYKTNSLKIESFKNEEIARIYLEPEVYEIPEVKIGPNAPTAADYVKKVIKNMHDNYQRSPYYMEGFLRDKVFNLYDNKNVRLTESAIEIVKREFGGENTADRVKIFEIRNSYNYSKLGSVWKEKLYQAFYGYSNANPAYVVLQNRDYTDPATLRKLLKNDMYSINFSGMTIYDSKPVQIVDIKEEYFEYLFQRIKSKNAYSLIKLYIDTETYAILKSEYINVAKLSLGKLDGVKFNFKQDTIGNYSVKIYENIQNKYYLKYASYFGRIHDQPDKNDRAILHFNETELLINKIVTSKKEFDRIKHRDLVKKETPLWDMKYVYDPSFWKNYNILIDKPLDPTVLKDLEQDVTLDNQFIDGGERNSKLTK